MWVSEGTEIKVLSVSSTWVLRSSIFSPWRNAVTMTVVEYYPDTGPGTKQD